MLKKDRQKRMDEIEKRLINQKKKEKEREKQQATAAKVHNAAKAIRKKQLEKKVSFVKGINKTCHKTN